MKGWITKEIIFWELENYDIFLYLRLLQFLGNFDAFLPVEYYPNLSFTKFID